MKTWFQRILSTTVAAGLLSTPIFAGLSGCSSGFPSNANTLRLTVQVTAPADLGSALTRKPVMTTPDKADSYTVRIQAFKPDGTVDTGFNGFVRLSVKPGTINLLSGPNTNGRSVALVNGVAENVVVPVYNAFGNTRIVADDLGYVPVDPPTRNPRPQCSDGIDNDGDGRIDFPADEGCAFANDDTESGGTYTAGASQTIFYQLPRVAQLRGAECTGEAPPICRGGAATPFKAQQVSVDTGYRPEKSATTFDFDMVVTRIASNGFYVQDTENDRASDNPCANPAVRRTKRGYGGLFMFNFNSPPGVRVCDRMRSLAGTATEFFGSIQLGYPTWTIEEWNPKLRPCGEPEPYEFTADDLGNEPLLLSNVHSLVRIRGGVLDRPDLDGAGNQICVTNTGAACNPGRADCVPQTTRHNLELRVTRHFGSGFPKANPSWDPRDPASPSHLITDNESNCDFNSDGRIDFEREPEKGCAAACNNDVECTEWSNFASRSNFYVVLTDKYRDRATPPKDVTVVRKIQADGSTSPAFKPLDFRGKIIKSLQGTLTYFSGGNQFTIEARCADDIGTDPAAPTKPFTEACVFERSEGELSVE